MLNVYSINKKEIWQQFMMTC